ncbi:hypothetical protein WR25_04510 [Diploscapter pachys]|uniref:MHD domain-containing protein n=1 Tax=Diploscapter pachys TaxID=2018661 RepID=A0A2A2LG16_9BILA|nr:hypothetical protein WR25_04510 [Diploscapter pachys]
MAVERELSAPGGLWPDADANSTASSSRSEDKHQNGSHQHPINPLDTPIGKPSTVVDEEGYTIRQDEPEEHTHWGSSCSSDDEDEVEMQRSKLKGLTIRPADASSRNAMNAASVDELRDAIGHISLARSSTFDKDPWSSTSNKPPIFSQTFAAGSLKPLRPNHTADGRFRTSTGESDFTSHTLSGGLNFSASMGPIGVGISRARPRSNTPTHNSGFGLGAGNVLNRKDSSTSIDWGSSFNVHSDGALPSLGDSSLNLSASTTNLMQATIKEQRIPIAMALNEYSHAWFKSADMSNKDSRVIRIFGTVLVSFASSSIPVLSDIHTDMEQLQFRLINSNRIKSVLPNKQLLLPHSPIDKYTFDRLALANWLLSQQREKPGSTFYNAEVLRYEVSENVGLSEPPLLFTSYWKCEDKTTDVRIDYKLNPASNLNSALLNIVFSTKIDSSIDRVVSEPEAQWDATAESLGWTLTELSRHGVPNGSLKARLHMKEGSKATTPTQTHVQFQCLDSNLSGVDIALETSDVYHLSMLKRKVQSGKYICDPEIRK